MTYSLSNILWLLLLPTINYSQQFFTNEVRPAKSKMIGWAVQKTSTLQILGSTNISSFGCDLAGYHQRDTIYCFEDRNTTAVVKLNGDLEIDISKFDCHNKMLTGDLRKTLKADEYPTFVIRFLTLERAPVIQANKDYLKGWVLIELAGVSRRFEVCYSFIQKGSSYIELNGKRSFNFADFNLTPPKKLAGLIKVRDKFNVEFNLQLDPLK